MDSQARLLNAAIKQHDPRVFSLLSEQGKALFFPLHSVPAQAAEAKGAMHNATIGIGLDDGGKPMRLASITQQLKLPPEDVFPYTSTHGRKELREAWLKKLRNDLPSLPATAAISMPVATAGLTHALSIAGALFLNPGEDIIFFSPCWGNYDMMFQLGCNAVLHRVPLFDRDKLNIHGLDKALSPQKKATRGTAKGKIKRARQKAVVLLNFPNNPVGTTPTYAEAEELLHILAKHARRGKRLVVICDDAYAGLVYRDGVMEESLFSRLATLHENILAVKVDGASKECYAWGLRVGFLTFAAKGIHRETCRALEDKAAGAVRCTVSNVSNLSQSLVLSAVTSTTFSSERAANYQLLKERFQAALAAASQKKYEEFFSPLPFNSGYFMCVRLRAGLDAENVRKHLLKKYKTGVIAHDKHLLRISFASLSTDAIPTVFENVGRACRDVART